MVEQKDLFLVHVELSSCDLSFFFHFRV
jgi:hypothetical protein